jgi:hypothetical protein
VITQVKTSILNCLVKGYPCAKIPPPAVPRLSAPFGKGGGATRGGILVASWLRTRVFQQPLRTLNPIRGQSPDDVHWFDTYTHDLPDEPDNIFLIVRSVWIGFDAAAFVLRGRFSSRGTVSLRAQRSNLCPSFSSSARLLRRLRLLAMTAFAYFQNTLSELWWVDDPL